MLPCHSDATLLRPFCTRRNFPRGAEFLFVFSNYFQPRNHTTKRNSTPRRKFRLVQNGLYELRYRIQLPSSATATSCIYIPTRKYMNTETLALITDKTIIFSEHELFKNITFNFPYIYMLGMLLYAI